LKYDLKYYCGQKVRDYLACFEDWKNRWHKCILSIGDYFKGDELDLEK